MSFARTLALAGLVASCLAISPSRAKAQGVPPHLEASILIKALHYDTAFPARVGSTLTVLVLYAPGHMGSEQMAQVITPEFRKITEFVAGGKSIPVQVEKIPMTSGFELKTKAMNAGVDVLYVCTGLESALAEISKVAQETHSLTAASKESYLTKGISIGVFVARNKPKININLARSKLEGVSFNSQLLGLSTVIR